MAEMMLENASLAVEARRSSHSLGRSDSANPANRWLLGHPPLNLIIDHDFHLSSKDLSLL
jgi:hypothetical protein